MYGQMTAGSWIYIGTQGILQGTYETFAELARQHFGGTLRGRVVLTAGLGGMGGAQPLAVTMNDGVALVIEVDEARARRRLDIGYVDRLTDSIDEALGGAQRRGRRPRPIDRPGRQRRRDRAGTGAPRRAVRRRDGPDLGPRRPERLRAHGLRDRCRPPPSHLSRCIHQPRDVVDGRPRPGDAGAAGGGGGHVRLWQQHPGAGPDGRGSPMRSTSPGFVPAFIRPLFCEGKGPVPLGGPVRRPGGHPADRPGDPGAVPGRRGAPPLDRDGRGARAVPGPAGPDLLAGLRRARARGAPRSTSSCARARWRRRS